MDCNVSSPKRRQSGKNLRARKLARLYKERPPLVLKLVKAAINDGMQMNLAQGIDYEAKCAALIGLTEDYREGMKAFVEKRKPVFKGQ